MSKENLRVAFVDMWVPWELEDFITPILAEKYKVILDDRNPDILFHSIFGANKKAPSYNTKKVLILAENWRPSQWGADYSISFDPTSGKNFRLPLWQIYWILNPELRERLVNRKKLGEFERFCSFTVSNGSNTIRNSHFDRLNEYKKVHSYGGVRTNDLSLKRATEGKYWRDAKDKFFLEHTHKFMMSYENTSYPWYCTEKLMDSFLVGSLPIYWGDPKVSQDWNENSFINIQKLGVNWLDRIKEVDSDKSLFESIYSEPVFTDRQLERHTNNITEFKYWLLNEVSK